MRTWASAHILQFVGAHRDGARFDHVSPPFRGDPDSAPARSRAELVAARALIEWPRLAAPRIKSGVASAAAATIDQPTGGQTHAGTGTDRKSCIRRYATISGRPPPAPTGGRRAKESVSNLHQMLDAAEGTVQQLDTAAADIQAGARALDNAAAARSGQPRRLSDTRWHHHLFRAAGRGRQLARPQPVRGAHSGIHRAVRGGGQPPPAGT